MHSHTHMVIPTLTATVVAKSQPCDPLSQGESVGICVGSPVGATLVGETVGSREGAVVGTRLVGSAVGENDGC